jgi:hypothetical protein
LNYLLFQTTTASSSWVADTVAEDAAVASGAVEELIPGGAGAAVVAGAEEATSDMVIRI